MEPIERVSELFRNQRAVRTFTADPVPDDVLLSVLDAATRAPSGSNTQPWRFLVIRDRAVKEALSLEYERAQAERAGRPEPTVEQARAGIMAQAPVLVVPCVRVPGRTGTAGFQTGASIYPACQNLMLAARAVGLGSVLTTTHRIRREQVHALLGIPGTYESAAIIPLGWPDRAYGPNHRAPVSEVVCWDHWSE
ncbi:MAG: nitroreductase family protein [Dehalococcoidia bacterium]